MATMEGISYCSNGFECLFKVLNCNNIIVCVLLVYLHGFYNKGLLSKKSEYKFMQNSKVHKKFINELAL